MSKQALNREQMQYLKELGIDTSRASMFWVRVLKEDRYGGKPEVISDWHLSFSKTQWAPSSFRIEYTPAFTLTDILDLLPKGIIGPHGGKAVLSIQPGKSNWSLMYEFDNRKDTSLLSVANEVIDVAYNMLSGLKRREKEGNKKMIKQVLDIDQVKYLESLGADTEDTTFVWRRIVDIPTGKLAEDWALGVREPEVCSLTGTQKIEMLPALSLADLISMLPVSIENYNLEIGKRGLRYSNDKDPLDVLAHYSAHYLIDAVYKMLCWYLKVGDKGALEQKSGSQKKTKPQGPNWEQRRYETAQKILTTSIRSYVESNSPTVVTAKSFAEFAVIYADAFIDKLKGGNEE